MTKSSKIWSLLTICVLSGVFVYIFLFDQRIFVFRTSQVEMQSSSLHPQILGRLKKRIDVRLLAHKNKNIWLVPLAHLQTQVLSDPWVESVTASRSLPSALHFEVLMKKIVFVHVNAQGKMIPISENGDLLTEIQIDEAPDVPILRNANVVKNPQKLLQLIAQYQQIPDEGVISKNEVAEIDLSEETGLRVDLANRGEEGSIYLGNENVHLKCKRVGNVLKYLESQKQKWRVIDASFSKKVLVRLRKHS